MNETKVFGFCLWWEAVLVPGVTLSTSPWEPRTHWEQVFLPLITPLSLRRADLLLLDLDSRSDPDYGGVNVTWNARIMHPHPGGPQQRSSAA